MSERLKRPTDPYDPAWVEYAKQNPGLRRSLSAADPDADPDPAPSPVDFSTFVPDTFKGEDGTYDVAKFRSSYDELAAFKGQEDDRKSQLPKEAGEYAFALPEDHAWPEGFDPTKFTTKDEQGNEVQFDVSKLIDAEDPDIPLLQSVLHEIGAPKEAMGKIASIVANREMRAYMQAMETAEAEKKALGPQADARIKTVEHALKAKMPAEQASAIIDNITSADTLRGIEALLKGSTSSPSPAPQKKDFSEMSRVDRIAAGLQERKSA